MRLLDHVNFEPLRAKMANPALLEEYKRFLALKAALGDIDAAMLSPPPEIDAIWHSHILRTKHYRTTCEILGHGFIDHDPDGGADEDARDTRRATSVMEYRKAFGAVPDVWSNMRPPLAPRRMAQQQQQHSPPSTQAKRPRTRAPMAKLAHEVEVGSYVSAQVTSRGRGGRLVARAQSGWVAHKSQSQHGSYWTVVFVLEDDKLTIPVFLNENDKVMPAKAEKPMPAWVATKGRVGPGRIILRIVTQDGNQLSHIMGNNAPLQHLMQSFCNRQGIAMNSIRFLFDGSRINPNQSPQELDMEDGDVIDVMVEQQGC